MFQSTVLPLTLWATLWTLSCALSAAYAAPVSQGETAPTALCVDTGQVRIPRLCATVVLRYKIDALMDVPLSAYGLNWSPSSWTFTLPDGSTKALPPDRLPTPLAKALSAATLQLKGTALVDFSAHEPLQYLQYQTNATPTQNKTSWTGASRSPMDKWLFTPGHCQDGPHHPMDPVKAMALYQLGVKSLSIDPRTSASLCKTGTVVSQLDTAIHTLERLCQAEASHPATPPSGLCRAQPLADARDATATRAAALSAQQTQQARWAALLDEGVPVQSARPTMALLDTLTLPAAVPSLASRCPSTQPADASCAPAQTVSSATHFPD